jgi:hypothetical protein
MSLTELALLDGRRPLPLWDVIGLTLTLTLGSCRLRDDGLYSGKKVSMFLVRKQLRITS